jgi:hypothetical protein
MEDRIEDEEFELNEPTDDAEVADHVSGTAIELEKLLSEGKTAEFFAAIGVERGFPEVDQLALLKESSKCSKGEKSIYIIIINLSMFLAHKKLYCENLFTFVSSLACITASREGMKTVDRMQNYATQFQLWMSECKRQEEHRNGILHLFEDFEWDSDFLAHCSIMQRSDPTDTFVKSHKLGERHISDVHKREIFFGSKIKAAYETAKRAIGSGANPLWVPPGKLPSGANVSGMFYSIRKRLWLSSRAIDLAKAAIRQEFKRDGRSFKEGDNRDVILQRAVTYDFQESYFPPWWLTFVYLGMPAGHNCRKQFQSGKAVLDQTDLNAIRIMSGKVNRRALDASYATPVDADKDGDSPPSSGPAAKKTKFEIVVKHEDKKDTKFGAAIKALRNLIGTMREIGDEESLQQIPFLLKQLKDLEYKEVIELVGEVATARSTHAEV